MVKRLLFVLCAAFMAYHCNAQLTSYPEKSKSLKQGIDLFQKEMFRSTIEKMDLAAKSATEDESLINADIEYYTALSAFRAGDSDAEIGLKNIVYSIPRNPHYNSAAYGYGKCLYEKSRFKESATVLMDINMNDLPISDRDEYCFITGYSHFRSGDIDLAISKFRVIKDKRSMYGDASLYYYSHIEYEKGNLTTASQGFERLKGNPNYSSILPYYTLQIAFKTRDYDKVIKEGEGFIKNAIDSRKGEICRLVAEAYLAKDDLTKAESFFKEYERTADLNREDKYLKGFIQYRLEKFADAANTFGTAQPELKDSLSQLISYYAGDCYIKLDKKSNAINQYKRASELEYNQDVKQSAYLNYAKLALELNDNETPIKNYLSEYPDEINNSELVLYIASSAAKREKYSEALDLVNKIENPSSNEKDVIKRISLAAGLDMFNKKDYEEANILFDKTLKNSDYNDYVSLQARYWKAACIYNGRDYQTAAIQYETFINTSAQYKSAREYKLAHYDLGYCYFKQNKYEEALRWFRDFIYMEAESTRKTKYLGDAYNRAGDCRFKKNDYQQAIDNYSLSEALALSEPDYAALQKSISLGFIDSNEAKLKSLQRIPKAYPKSNYLAAVYYEIGRTHLQSSDYGAATESFQTVLNKYKESPYYPKTLVQMGLIELNKGNEDKALSYYQQVAEKWPESPESKDALEGIKDIYIAQNKPEEFIAYMSRVGQTVKNPDQKDSIVFTAAEKQYQNGDCNSALPAIKKYITDYPQGKYKMLANFYLADCSMKKNNLQDAINGYSFVIKSPNSELTEPAWSGYARANYALGKFEESAKAFEKLRSLSSTTSDKLDAEIGCMRSYLALKNDAKAVKSAEIIAFSKADPELVDEANLVRGRVLQNSGEHAKAIAIFKDLAKDLTKSIDAEAGYRMASSLYDLKKYKDAEEIVYKYSEQKSRQLFWIAKSFILLGDIFKERKELDNARDTYKSIVDNYKNTEDGVLNEATEKYNEISN